MGGSAPLIAAIEAGGTKIVCAAGTSWQQVRDAEKLVLETSAPDTTLASIGRWLRGLHETQGPVAAVGVASFGPVDLAAGRISATSPKLAWRGVDWPAAIARVLVGSPVAVETDTNAAALAEHRVGAAGGGTSVYVTVGTGIGAGIVVNGAPVHGLAHPEVGHMAVPRGPGDDFAGVCPAHGDCLEGLASGPAVRARWGRAGEQLPPDHDAWRLEAHYLACCMVNLTTVVSPEVIVLGGGVMAVEQLLETVRTRTLERLNRYVPSPALVAPELQGDSGVVGAYFVGEAALPSRAGGAPG